jgi:hypothetical protein
MSYIKISIKQVYSLKTMEYEVNKLWTINEMIQNLVPKISVDFDIIEDDIEIVPNNQYEECVPLEMMKSLNELEYRESTIEEKYGPEFLTGFYLRRRNYSYSESPLLCECVVCLNNRITTNRFGCIHQLCNICYNGCRRIAHNRCPVCRQNLIGETM